MTKGSFEIDVPALKAALKDVAGVIEARNTVPILSNVLLVVSPSALIVTGTDLDCWGERHVAIDKGAAMAFTVEAGVLGRIVDKLPSEAQALITLNEGKVTVVAGRSRFSLPTLPVDDFPALPTRDWDAEFEMPAVTLLNAIGAVSFAMSTEETRYYLNGVLMHAPGAADLRFAATDGHRLARGVVAAPDGVETLPDIIVPRKVLKVLEPLLSRHEGTVDLRVGAGQLRVEVGSTVVQAKMIDGQFPDYERVIPTGHTTLVNIDREALAAAVARVATISSDKTRAVKLDFGRDLLTLSVTSPEHGMATEEVPCEHTGGALTIGFNARFMLDTLSHLSSLSIEILMTDGAGPTLWRDGADSALTYVLMPLRV